jgi:hypothetical protein
VNNSSSSKTSSVAPATSPAIKTTVTNDEDIGDEAAKSGDWETAIQAYAKVFASRRTASVLYKYGNAQLKAGDEAAATTSLREAAEKGSEPAKKALEQISG